MPGVVTPISPNSLHPERFPPEAISMQNRERYHSDVGGRSSSSKLER